jgi:hypothetical protein
MIALPDDVIQVKAFDPESIKVQCTDIESFRIVQKYFHKNETDFYTPIRENHQNSYKGFLVNISAEESQKNLQMQVTIYKISDNLARVIKNFPYIWYHSLTLLQTRTYYT